MSRHFLNWRKFVRFDACSVRSMAMRRRTCLNSMQLCRMLLCVAFAFCQKSMLLFQHGPIVPSRSTIEAFFFFFTVHSFHGAPVGPRLSLGAPPGLPLNVNASGARWSSASVMFKRANLIVASMVKASDPYPILEVRHLLL